MPFFRSSKYFEKLNPPGKLDRKLSGLERSEKCSMVKNKAMDMFFELREMVSKKKEKVVPNIKHGCT